MNKIANYKWKKRVIYIESDSKDNLYFKNLQLERKKASVIAGLKERKVKVIQRIIKTDKPFFLLHLYGLDGEIKHIMKKFSSFESIFKKIDSMPMRKTELKDPNYKPIDKQKYTLYSDDNPNDTIKNTGFKNSTVARKTIYIVNNLKDKRRAKQIINTMIYRAKFHPYQTKDMREAIKIFKKWMDKN
ncbi:MAG: hypothetical protein CMF62_00655 [Magnetococcales bacterium]|nr:hypothetical protein [Magnetococcales bacterium]|tara:strand:- start:22113 stop:22673 length:561 start_codon:yes stop_codon:yes gene_type:complete